MNTEERVNKVIIGYLKCDPKLVQRTASFVNDLGADSLDTVEIVMALEEEFGVSVPDSEAEKITTVGQAIDYVDSQLKDPA